MSKILLTQFSHGGGCGCKIAPNVLTRLLANTQPQCAIPAQLLVGLETGDDAAVYQVNEQQAVVATTDFFMPIVDEPYDFGRIAATNALSDIYAMGAQPLFALAIVGMPIDKLPEETIRAILAGGEAACAAAGIVIAGGHSIDAPEPIYGLVAIGLVHPQHIKRNSGGQENDVLILSKPLGIGILSAALKQGKLDLAAYQDMLRWTTLLNITGTRLSAMAGVHAVTDVTGFGLIGHTLEMCRGANLSAEIKFAHLPMIDTAAHFAKDQAIATGASARNWQSYSAYVDGVFDHWQKVMLTDPQTSGGLLIACAQDSVEAVLSALRADGCTAAAEIGHLRGLHTGLPRCYIL